MAGNEQLPATPEELTTLEQVREFVDAPIGRRAFNKTLGIAGLGVAAAQFGCASSANQGAAARQIYVQNATGLVLADNSLCVGCRRCESACVAFNHGKAQPAVSNIKINRNLSYGVNGVVNNTGGGLYGNFVVVQNCCNQCPHPVPCQLACPHGAIEVTGPVNARVVNTAKCVGCGTCLKSCPWEMTSLDGPVLAAGTKSHKCTLCAGAPECVAACTAGALQYVPWTDRTQVNPPRQAVAANIQLPSDVASTCASCH